MNSTSKEMASHGAAIEEEEEEEALPPGVGRVSVLSYGCGHMLNDITSACWFTYLLLFLTDLGLSPRQAAAVMLSGQTADAFATIFVGELVPLLFTSITRQNLSKKDTNLT